MIVTGSHLLKDHGMTINEIKKDGFKISSKFSMYERNRIDSGVGMIKSLGKCIIKLSTILEKEKPDIILAGFDIGANLAVAIAGAHMNIIVAHVEGGDVTGTIDESIRHAITKFSHIHFTSNKEASKRIIKMGENPKYVFTVGSPVIDSMITTPHISNKKLSKKFGLDFSKPFVLILQHTVTSEINNIDQYIKNTLSAIKEENIQAIIIYGNADAGSQKISRIIKNSKINQVSTTNFDEYINLLKRSLALVGNSSSGAFNAWVYNPEYLDFYSELDIDKLHFLKVNVVDQEGERINHIVLKTIDLKPDKNQSTSVSKRKEQTGYVAIEAMLKESIELNTRYFE